MKLVNSIGFSEIKPRSSRKTAVSKNGVLDIGDTSVQGHGLDLETIAMLKAVLTAGLYPCVAKTTSTPAVDAAANPTKVVCVAETAQGVAQIHPASVNRFLQTNGWLVYLEKVNCRCCAGADLEVSGVGGVQSVRTPILKFENCPFYLLFFYKFI